MLKLLKIKNIALMTELALEFADGLVLLTGETGAGKSIVIDSLGLLLGERASPELVRSGEDRAFVEAVFEIPDATALLEERGLPTEGDEVVLRREIQSAGKGRATVNGAIVPVGLLKELAPRLAVIHGQHEPQGLVDPATHAALLDEFADVGAGRPIAEYYRDLRAAESALARLREDRREAERRREMLDFQATEIEKARLAPGEEDALRSEKLRQANAGRLATLSGEAYALLYDDEAAVLGRLRQVFKRLEELASVDRDFQAYAQLRSSLVAPLEDLALRLRDYHETLEVSPGRLDEIEARLAQMERLKKKYGATIEDVIAFGERCRGELLALGSPEAQENALVERCAQLRAAYLERARAVSRARHRAAGELRKRVQSELAQLAMEKTRFEVAFDPADPETAAGDPARWTERGLEASEFVISPNPGEELRPLARIASGGELSRMMLALRSVIGHEGRGLTMVFDEVDAGIGGRVAEVVGRKLRTIAAGRQVLCVTHLPQIAALADQHLFVSKRTERGRTVASVSCLSESERVEEIARMLGGETITPAARDHAREMLKSSLQA
jgi:DNA repair protein RecN (Recombination protein N)